MNYDYPSITVAIPTYNEQANLNRCLSSIFTQKYAGYLEVIIIDDGSTDLTLQIAKLFPVRILQNGHHSGEYGKMIGFLNSHTKYFMYLDADINLVGNNWFLKVVEPLEKHPELAGSFTGYSSEVSDSPLNKFITWDFLQRDPLFSWLTPSLQEVTVSDHGSYVICQYSDKKILPSGLCLYRRSFLKPLISHYKKFMELDNLVMLVEAGHDRFAYVKTVSLHHPFIHSLSTLLKKRERNLNTMYFDQPTPRKWTWINWSSPRDLLKLVTWIILVNTLIIPIIWGLKKSIQHHSLIGLYEPVFSWLVTNVTLIAFIKKTFRRGHAY